MRKIFFLLLLTVATLTGTSQVSVQWGDSILAFSSAWPSQTSQQVLGPYNVYPNCGDLSGAWASLTADGQREFIEVTLATPMPLSEVQIFETNAAGAIDTVYVRQQGTSLWTNVYQATAAATACRILNVVFPQTAFNVDAIRIALNSPAVPDWNEIDAVRFLKNPFSQIAPIYDSLEYPIDHFVLQVNPWIYQGCVNPNGDSKNGIRANNYNFPPAAYDLFTQTFDLTGLNKPILSFYDAHKGYTGSAGGGNDGLEVAVSTDGGTNYTPLLLKHRQDNPSLSTEDVTFSFYVPGSVDSWRHEIIDLSTYANQPSLIVRFRSFSTFDNNIWIDDFKIVDATTINKTAVTGTPTIVSGNISVKFTSNTRNGDCYIISNTGTATYFRNKFNPAGGATTPDGSTIACDSLSPEYFTVSYTGQDYLNTTLAYDIEIDATSYIATLGSLDQCYIVKRTDEWSPWQPATTTRTGNILKIFGLTRFCQFAVASEQLSTLPVTLLNFTALKNDHSVSLQWQTAQEQNNRGFEVQRSGDGISFSAIGWVNGLGNSSSPHDYSFTDAIPLKGKNFYRLKQIDLDNNSKLSGIRKIDFNKIIDLNVYPNPVSDVMNIQLGKNVTEIKILDPMGRLVWQKGNTGNVLLISVSVQKMTRGLYILEVSDREGNHQTQIFIKN
jgi:Secretion system C-terminal sorting domain